VYNVINLGIINNADGVTSGTGGHDLM